MAVGRDVRAQRRQVLALLLAATAVVLPIAAWATLTPLTEAGWSLSALFAAGQVELIGPLLLIGALAIAAIGGPSTWPPTRRTALAVLCIVAGAILTLVFAGGAYAVVAPDAGVTLAAAPEDLTALRATAAVELGAQVLVSAAATWFAIRLLPTERRLAP